MKVQHFISETKGPRGKGRMGLPLILFLAIVILGMPDPASSQPYRKTVEFPPTEVFQSIFNLIDNKEYAKIPQILKVLSPITDHIADKYKHNPADAVNQAVEKGDPDEILSSVQTLMVLDIKDLLDEAGRRVEKSSQDAKPYVNAARLDFEVLSPFIQKTSLKEDQKIRMQFIDSLEALGTKSLYSSERDKVSPDKMKRVWTEITASLSQIFPHKGP